MVRKWLNYLFARLGYLHTSQVERLLLALREDISEEQFDTLVSTQETLKFRDEELERCQELFDAALRKNLDLENQLAMAKADKAALEISIQQHQAKDQTPRPRFWPAMKKELERADRLSLHSKVGGNK